VDSALPGEGELTRADSAPGQATRGYSLAGWMVAGASPSDRRERLLLAWAGLFLLLGTLTLTLTDLSHWSGLHWSLLGVWGICFGGAHLVLCRRAPRRDPFLLPLAGLLTGWGLLLIARLADVAFLVRQSIWLVVSSGVFVWIVARPPGLRWLRRYRYTWLLGGLFLLATTLVLGANPSGYGPRLWLGGRFPALGNVYFQPSEILKLLMVAYLSSYLAEKRELVLQGPRMGRARLPSWPYLAPLLVMWGLAMVLLAWQQDLGAGLLFFLTFLVMLYLSSGQWLYVVVGLALFLIAAAGAYLLFATVALRVDIWLNPWADPDGRAFQIVQSLIALGSGGMIGQGLGQGSPTYIPAIHTDFPFAAIAEETGLLGVLGLITALAVLTLRGARIALHARSTFRRLLAAGLATLIGLQAWIIMAGNIKLTPLTGVTLPFVSYGGSSLLSSFIALALLTVVSRDERWYVGETLAPPLHPPHGGGQRGGRRWHHRRTPPSSPPGGGTEGGGRQTMMRAVRQVSLGLLLAFAVLAGVSGYWMLLRRDALRARGDNPRLVEAEQRAARGPILDRQGVTLAYSAFQAPGGLQRRIYLTPTMPAVGYYSLQYGVGGIEASRDTWLRGLEGRSVEERFLDELLHRQPEGHSLMLTLDARLQTEISHMLAGTGEETPRGAVVVLDVVSGQVLALVSQPTYDPNTLQADWEQLQTDPAAPLLNRAAQGLYQPGGAVQLLVLEAALDAGVARLDTPVDDPAAPIAVNGRELECVQDPQDATLGTAVSRACPAPMAELGQVLGASLLETTWHRWGLDAPPALEIPTEAGRSTVSDPRLAAIGQETLTVTPLHMALVMAALGNEGRMPLPALVLCSKKTNGTWRPVPTSNQAVPVTDAAMAARLRTLLRPLHPLRLKSTGAQVLGYSALALAGTDRQPHAWYLGLAPAQAPRYAVAVLLEHGGASGLTLAERVGQEALLSALVFVPNP
jgi:cell division protein FtsW (lipid II flippase)